MPVEHCHRAAPASGFAAYAAPQPPARREDANAALICRACRFRAEGYARRSAGLSSVRAAGRDPRRHVVAKTRTAQFAHASYRLDDVYTRIHSASRGTNRT